MVPPVRDPARDAGGEAAGGDAAGGEDAMTALLRQLVLNDTRRAGNNRPKAIRSCTFIITNYYSP